MKKLIPMAFLMVNVLSMPFAQADSPDWKQVTSSQQKYQLSVNAKTLQREDDVVNATLRYAYGDTQVIPFLNLKFDRLERRFAFQCGERKMVMLENNYFLGENKVHTVNPAAPNPFQPKGQPLVPQKVEPGTVEDEALTQACAFPVAKK